MTFSHRFALLAAAVCLPIAASATDFSRSVTSSTPVAVYQPVAGKPLTYIRVLNAGAASGGVAWCSRTDTSPAPNKAGSYPLAPYGNALGQPTVEEYASGSLTGTLGQLGQVIPQDPIYCIADTGTVPLSVYALP